MKKLVLFVMVVLATWVGLTWGGVTVEAASPFKVSQEPANQVTKFKIQGDGAFAHFADSDECGDTPDVQVGVNDEAIKEGSGKWEITSRVLVVITYSNICTGQIVSLFSDVIIPPEAFTMGDKLGSAALNTEVKVCCDDNKDPFSVYIDLTWTAFGPVMKGNSKFTSKEPGCKMSFTVNGDYRDAVVDGSITVFDNDLALQPLVFAGTQSVKNGEMSIGCD